MLLNSRDLLLSIVPQFPGHSLINHQNIPVRLVVFLHNITVICKESEGDLNIKKDFILLFLESLLQLYCLRP